jgi:CheY-like chemotaxis protein
VQQILAFSRQSAQQRQQVYLHLILEETLTLLRASLPSTIELRQSLATHTGMVLADPVQLQQVVMNLCTNAEHAMRPKGGQLDICLDSVDIDATMATTLPDLMPGTHIRLTVRDTGHGMMPEVLERIFEPFFTTKGPGEGTGMGLAVVHGIVASYAGAITVASTPGQGTTFAIYFPRLPGIVEVTDSTEELLPKGEGRILFVDDETALADLAQAMLTRLGYDTEVYISSRAALAAFQAAPQRFDLVITDQTMPSMTGEALTLACRHIRPDIPIILCTGFSHVMTIEKAGLLGVDAFLMKPLVIHDLGLAIQRVLASRRSVL